MTNLEFYNQGVKGVRGPRRLVVPVRRLLRRVLRPFFQAQVTLYQMLLDRDDHLSLRIEALEDREIETRLDALEGREVDMLALSRRLAAIEDRLFSLPRDPGPPPQAGGSPHVHVTTNAPGNGNAIGNGNGNGYGIGNGNGNGNGNGSARHTAHSAHSVPAPPHQPPANGRPQGDPSVLDQAESRRWN